MKPDSTFGKDGHADLKRKGLGESVHSKTHIVILAGGNSDWNYDYDSGACHFCEKAVFMKAEI